MAKPAEPVNSQDERRICAAVDSPARLCWQTDKGRQQVVLPPSVIINAARQPYNALCGGKGEFP